MQTETAKPMGALLPGIVAQTDETASPEPSTALAVSISLAGLPARLDDRMLEMVRTIANSPPLRAEPCSTEHFAKCMRSLDILPRRNDDELTGELKVKLYWAKLRHVPNAGWSYLVSAALDQCQWFPTIAECQRIIAGWAQVGIGEERRKQARYLVQREMNARMDEAVARLATRTVPQDEIDAMPDQWKRVAAEKCFLWAWPDGRFTVRRDLRAMSDEAAEVEREAVAAMMAEWARIKVAQAASGEDDR